MSTEKKPEKSFDANFTIEMPKPEWDSIRQFRKQFLNPNTLDSSSQFKEEVRGKLPELFEAFIKQIEKKAEERIIEKLKKACWCNDDPLKP